MASDNSHDAADLNSVLRTLSSLAAGSSQSTASAQPQNIHPETAGPIHRPTPEIASHNPHQPQSNALNRPATPTVDPATITTWPAALRYVMRTVAQSEETQLRIRGLIRSQHSHERQWWNSREALVKKQLDSKEVSTAKEDEAEITNYDAKVYKASAQMADALIAELRGLRIPFFVLRSGLVRDSPAGGDVKSSDQAASGVTRNELADLQRRMLELLQDLCKE
ncbi:hypothetical protein NUU61_006989 [Penicillium alfredii]|uniref:Uncharacterized protein n=1 Tax=Penicillium alfredii TaxID=1506179 RepID=A0A9W9F203_9EURO|nr:uncharacterized protein NUU61_006989 [Penicillium alfredii]KAJ5092119.1 hypothetical protein NUU61_006989 [Penicillium alfredii]